MRINDLTQFQIEAVESRENFLSKFFPIVSKSILDLHSILFGEKVT